MKLFIQRVQKADIYSRYKKRTAQIGEGLLVYVDFSNNDKNIDMESAIQLLLNAKLWADRKDEIQLTKSVYDKKFEIAIVLSGQVNNLQLNQQDMGQVQQSQNKSLELYKKFVSSVQQAYLEKKVKSGSMDLKQTIKSTNEGPIFLLYESNEQIQSQANNDLVRNPEETLISSKPQFEPEFEQNWQRNHENNAEAKSLSPFKLRKGFENFIAHAFSESIPFIFEDSIKISNTFFTNHKPMSLLLCTSLCTTQNLSVGLPFDFVAYFTTAERLRRILGAECQIIHVIGDTYASDSKQASGNEEYIKYNSYQEKNLIEQAVKNLNMSDTYKVFLASDFHSQEDWKEIYSSIMQKQKDLKSEYVRQQCADVEYWRIHANAIVKLSWQLAKKKNEITNDERYFDQVYEDTFGNQMSFIYSKPGRTTDPNKHKACPHTATSDEYRILLSEPIDRNQIENFLYDNSQDLNMNIQDTNANEQQEKSLNNVRLQLLRIIKEFQITFGDLQGEDNPVEKVQQIIKVFQDTNQKDGFARTLSSFSSFEESEEYKDFEDDINLLYCRSNTKTSSNQVLQRKKSEVNKKLENLKKIESKIQDDWLSNKAGEANAQTFNTLSENTDKNKYFIVTSTLPSINNKMDLNSLFQFSLAEFQARFQKQMGKNVLFPIAFNCNGYQWYNQSYGEDMFKRKDSLRQSISMRSSMRSSIIDRQNEQLQQQEVQINQLFEESKRQLQEFGFQIDWRRTFTLSKLNKYFESFMMWQISQLIQQGKIYFGKRPAIFSPQQNSICSEDERSQGQSAQIIEYTIVKQKLLTIPAKIKNLNLSGVIYVAAFTSRPETMYGQTNCFINPSGEYGLYEMHNNEYFICSEHSIRNMAYQGLTKLDRQYEALITFEGFELVGLEVKAPLSFQYDYVFILPLESVQVNKGTGIIASVPSADPEDFIALRELQQNQELRQKFFVRDEWINRFQPVPIIYIPNIAHEDPEILIANNQYEELKAEETKGFSHKNDSAGENNVDKLRHVVEKKGYEEGTMIVGCAQGLKVKEAQVITKRMMIEQNFACNYFETDQEVISSQTGDKCVVTFEEQYIMRYGDKDWKAFVQDYIIQTLKSNSQKQIQQELLHSLDHLKEMGCSKTSQIDQQSLDVHIPFDERFTINQLYESSLIMAFYTIAHLLQERTSKSMMDKEFCQGEQEMKIGDSIDEIDQQDIYENSELNLHIKPESLSFKVWDYIFLRGEYPENCQIPQVKLDQLRGEFEYWYPLDMRCVAKEQLKTNALISLFTHGAIWQNQEMMPQDFHAEQQINDNYEISLRQCLEKFGADSVRLALAQLEPSSQSAASQLFEDKLSDAFEKIYEFKQWVKDICKQIYSNPDQFEKTQSSDMFDNIFENELNFSIEQTKQEYAQFQYKRAVEIGFFDLQKQRDHYLIGKKGSINAVIILKFIETVLILLNPICPHITQYCWQKYFRPAFCKYFVINKSEASSIISEAGWPIMTNNFNFQVRKISEYVNEVRQSVLAKYSQIKKSNKDIENCIILTSQKFKEWQEKVIQMISQRYTDDVDIESLAEVIRKEIDEENQAQAIQLAQHLLNDIHTIGREKAFSKISDEKMVIKNSLNYILDSMPNIKYKTVMSVDEYDNSDAEENLYLHHEIIKSAVPGQPAIHFY